VTSGERHYGPVFLITGLTLLAGVSVAILLVDPIQHVLVQRKAPSEYDPVRMVLLYSTLPRLVMATLCGAGLAASSAILQQVLRNPLASPTTLGIDAGARLALALTTLFVPSLFGIGRDGVALFGSAASTLLVFTLVRQRDFSAVSIVLAGLVVSLYCGALSAILVLAKDRTLASLFIWGSGSLSQQSWKPSIALAWRLGIMAPFIIPLVRQLSLLDLGDESARSAGLSLSKLRLFAVSLAVVLSALITSAVGVVGFIGMAAPVITRLAGVRRFGERLLWSSVVGGLLLLLTDSMLQNFAGVSSEFIPTGAVTAVLGSPLLLFLLPRLKVATKPFPNMGASRGLAIPLSASVVIFAAIFAMLFLIAVFIGRGPSGEWQITPMRQWYLVMPWRLPRLGAAASGGALLGLAGFILQRLTGNEMASPEVLGVSAGSILAVAVALFAFGSISGISEGAFGTVGGFCVLGAILALGRRSGFAPERVLLAGIALNALIDALVGVLSATGDPRAITLLHWIAGSTGGTTPAEALGAGTATIILFSASLPTVRWLAILPLGSPQAQALGVSLAPARFLLFFLAAMMTAAATPVLGPFTFVGLMAPHIVLVTGIRRVLPALPAVAAVGAVMMTAADWFSRTVAFPIQLPTGLVAALLGAPFLMILLSRRSVLT
jgi:iron complex transport system permease protein